MFQPQPPAAQRRHRRLPSGTMVSYAEVKSYLSKREIPQLFESLMAGLMYHRPENHIGYLQSCLDEVKTNNETKIHWSTFVNKKRKSKEILPPLTPKKQDSFSSSWSDNSRQSTPLPPISARTVRTRTSPDQQQQDLRNTYILYHNPPPILAKPKVPVVSVLGGLGSKVDELCESVVGRLRGVVHISTSSMLKTRMTIEGFYRITSVPACAVVDSVLQAMSMVQSSNALIVAGFPRNRGDIEEYRSRRVRMDGVVLVDFEEESLRSFLKNEVAMGSLRVSDIETELERYKQDIISVAEYYDEKELLTVVMGDQDEEEMVEDIIVAVDKIIETRKSILDEGDSLSSDKPRECETDEPRNALLPSPETVERPSTVEIREATEEDIKAIEAEAKNSGNEGVVEDVKTLVESVSNTTDEQVSPDTSNINPNQANNSENSEEKEKSAIETEERVENAVDAEKPGIPLLFAFENINSDHESLKDLIVGDKGMCYIEFSELVRSDGEKDDCLNPSDSIDLLQSVLQRDSISYSNGFFISGFPFILLKENKIDEILKLGDVTFICKIKEKTTETESEDNFSQEDLLFKSPLSENVKIIFVTESNMVEELKSFFEEMESGNKCEEDSLKQSINNEDDMKSGPEVVQEVDVGGSDISVKESAQNEDINNIEQVGGSVNNEASDEISKSDIQLKSDNIEVRETGVEVEEANQNSPKDVTSGDDNEDSTCRDVEDLISDDALLDEAKSSEIIENEEKDSVLKDAVKEDTLSETSMERSSSAETLREKAVLARQDHLDIETESISQVSDNLAEGQLNGDVELQLNDRDSATRNKLIRQATFSSGQEPPSSSTEEVQEKGTEEDEELLDKRTEENTELQEKEVGTDIEAGDSKANEDKQSDSDPENKSEELLPSNHSEENIVIDKVETEVNEKVAEDNENISDNPSESKDKVSNDDSKEEDQVEEKQTPRSEASEKDLTNVSEEKDSLKSEKNDHVKDSTSIDQPEGGTSDKSSNDEVEEAQKQPDAPEENNLNENIEVAEDLDSNKSDKEEKDSSKDNISINNNVDVEQPILETSEVNPEESSGLNDDKLRTESESKKEDNLSEENLSDEKSEETTIENNANNEDAINTEKSAIEEPQNGTNNNDSSTAANEPDSNEAANEENSEANKLSDANDKKNEDNEPNEENGETNEENGTNDENKNCEESEDKDDNKSEDKDDVKSEDKDDVKSENKDDVKSEDKDEEKSEDKEPKENSVTSEAKSAGSTKSEQDAEVLTPTSEGGNDEISQKDDETAEENADGIETPSKATDEDTDKNPSASEKISDSSNNKNETELRKIIDNDSDTNDEGSVTIETKAEIHAADSKSPAPIEANRKSPTHSETNIADSKSPTLDEASDTDSKSPPLDKNSADDNKSLPLDETSAAENKSPPLSDSSAVDVKISDLQQELEKETDDDKCPSKKDVQIEEKQNGANDIPETPRKEDSLINSEVTETTAIEDINNLNNERYSAKYQERNGSGILGESRQEDQPDIEEPQERSSSSSRGEL